MEEPKDLGLVVTTKPEALWIKVRDIQEARIDDLENELIISKELLRLAKDKILLEKRK